MHLPSNFFPSTTPQLLCLRDSTRNPFIFIDLRGIPQPRPNRFIHSSPADLREERKKRPLRRRPLPGQRATEGARSPRLRPPILIEQPEFGPIEPRFAGALAREAAKAVAQREANSRAATRTAKRLAEKCDDRPSRGAAKERSPRRKPWEEPENNPAPKERKNPRDPSSDKVENSKEYERIQQAEAAIPGAMAGNWRDLRTVFEFVGISEPSKEAPTASESAASEPR